MATGRWVSAFVIGLVLGAGTAWAEGPKVVFGVPGIPPIFASVLPHVAAERGLFKKYGADVEVRDFETGVAATRAVAAGQIDLAIAPTGAQLTLSAFFFGFGGGQLIYGPIADRFGRRVPLLVGLALFTAANPVQIQTAAMMSAKLFHGRSMSHGDPVSSQ